MNVETMQHTAKYTHKSQESPQCYPAIANGFQRKDTPAALDCRMGKSPRPITQHYFGYVPHHITITLSLQNKQHIAPGNIPEVVDWPGPGCGVVQRSQRPWLAACVACCHLLGQRRHAVVSALLAKPPADVRHPLAFVALAQGLREDPASPRPRPKIAAVVGGVCCHSAGQ